ncbi:MULTISPECIES: metallophosphoesterase family protein [Rufibacter]|uniref:3',5'-cyclic AMP phosphodiesterase CpdA n=1 Tax=Rufibacter quisquiliarum TaxID=1549639 RepID=A0A839GAT0_9BACT|nr:MULTISPECIES: metallophosphoesterase [Rufibacter]MBA9076032.1 3',5'-cyclic AMP phosphodiesterase CpdA [Rufibacter quisquiliarum]
MKRIPFLIYPLLLLLLSACEGIFEYHPNQIRLKDSEKNLTQKNLARLLAQAPGDTLRLLVMGDTQRFYDATVDFVDKANSIPHIDLVVHLGDISDFGLSQEFRWVHDIMKNLKYPYLTVIGNHDMLGNARTVYSEMYGAFNYSFVYGHTKFIFIDTNGREYGFNGLVPDLDWLQQQLTPEPDAPWTQAVVVSHVPPFDGDFDPQLELPYHQTLAQSGVVPLSLHGHRHSWQTETRYNDPSILYHVTTTVKERGFTYLKLWDGGYSLEKIDF